MKQFERVAHIGIRVRDLDRARAFYRVLLPSMITAILIAAGLPMSDEPLAEAMRD